MLKFDVVNASNDAVIATHGTVHVALEHAIRFFAQTHGETGRFVRTAMSAALLTDEGVVTYRVQEQKRRPAGRPVTKVVEPKPFRFAGPEPASGWYKSPVRCELDIHKTGLLLPKNRTPDDYFLIYMAADGIPLQVVPIEGVLKEAKALAAALPDRRGSAVHKSQLACRMALGCLLERPPATAVAIFVVHPDYYSMANGALEVDGKRLLSRTKYEAYVTPVRSSTTMLASSPQRQSYFSDEAKAALAEAYANAPKDDVDEAPPTPKRRKK